jgi:hypothetical protein
VAAFDNFKQRQDEAERTAGRPLSAVESLRSPEIDAAMERVFDLIVRPARSHVP